jgi:aldehyde dehydrogenase (NAD+)
MATVTRTALKWDYAPAPESRDAASLKQRYELFIDGEFSAPKDGTRVNTINPSNEEPLAEVAFAGPKDVARAVAAARAAAPKWQALPALERGKYLFRIARLIQERSRELAVVESLDGGKPIRESRDVDIPLAAAHFFSYAGWTSSAMPSPAGRSSRAASSARSCRGTSRC